MNLLSGMTKDNLFELVSILEEKYATVAQEEHDSFDVWYRKAKSLTRAQLERKAELINEFVNREES